jgi:hypothetical protein
MHPATRIYKLVLFNTYVWCGCEECVWVWVGGWLGVPVPFFSFPTLLFIYAMTSGSLSENVAL